MLKMACNHFVVLGWSAGLVCLRGEKLSLQGLAAVMVFSCFNIDDLKKVFLWRDIFILFWKEKPFGPSIKGVKKVVSTSLS